MVPRSARANAGNESKAAVDEIRYRNADSEKLYVFKLPPDEEEREMGVVSIAKFGKRPMTFNPKRVGPQELASFTQQAFRQLLSRRLATVLV
jgi:hypothetical protein